MKSVEQSYDTFIADAVRGKPAELTIGIFEAFKVYDAIGILLPVKLIGAN